jgi:hypothetical protein
MDAEKVLLRFARVIDQAAAEVTRTFSPRAEREDVAQEAGILIASYSGLMPGTHNGKLSYAEKEAGGDEARVQRIIRRMLVLDLSSQIGRQAEKAARLPEIPVDTIPADMIQDNGFEDQVISRLDADYDFRISYPTLYRMFFGHQAEAEIAAADGVTARAVRYRVAAEKARAKDDPQVQSRARELGIRPREEIPKYLTEDTAWEHSQSYRCPACHAGATVTAGAVSVRHQSACPRQHGIIPTRGTRLGHVNFGPLGRCPLMRNGRGPEPGHCRWCDARTPVLAAA